MGGSTDVGERGGGSGRDDQLDGRRAARGGEAEEVGRSRRQQLEKTRGRVAGG